MKTTTYDEWLVAVREDLALLPTLDLGRRMGVNKVMEPSSSDLHRVPVPLWDMYRAFDGLSLPDVYNGYFIDSAARVVSAAERGMPIKVVGVSELSIHVFGSDGGDGLFALGLADSAVYYLPSWGGYHDGVFVEDELTRVRRVADSVQGFLWRLQGEIRAFVQGDVGHVCMNDWEEHLDWQLAQAATVAPGQPS